MSRQRVTQIFDIPGRVVYLGPGVNPNRFEAREYRTCTGNPFTSYVRIDYSRDPGQVWTVDRKIARWQ